MGGRGGGGHFDGRWEGTQMGENEATLWVPERARVNASLLPSVCCQVRILCVCCQVFAAKRVFLIMHAKVCRNGRRNHLDSNGRRHTPSLSPTRRRKQRL